MKIAPLADLAVPAEVSGANPEAKPSEGFESFFNVALGEGTAEGAGTQGTESTEISHEGEEAEAQPGDSPATDVLGAERIEGVTESVAPFPLVATSAPTVPEATAPDPDGRLPAAIEIDPTAIQTPEVAEISNLGSWGGSAAAVPAAHEASPQPGSSPAEVRARAVEAFRERTERLWGFWLRGHGGGSPGGAETLPDPAAAGPAAMQLPELEAIRASSPVSGSDAGQNTATLTELSPSSLASSQPAADIPTDAARGDAGTQADSLSPAARPARAPADHPLAREATGPRAAEPTAQVAQAVRVSLARGGNRVTVRLEPESLGKVHVVLAREAGGVTAHFRVETPQAHQALQGDLTQLRQALESRGVPLVEVFVDLDHGQSRGENPWAGLDGHRRRSRPDLAGRHDDDELPVRPASWRPWGFDARV